MVDDGAADNDARDELGVILRILGKDAFVAGPVGVDTVQVRLTVQVTDDDVVGETGAVSVQVLDVVRIELRLGDGWTLNNKFRTADNSGRFIALFPAVNGYFLIPATGSLIAAMTFDRSGTTRIGKYLVNHSFMMPGLVATVTAVATGMLLARILF